MTFGAKESWRLGRTSEGCNIGYLTFDGTTLLALQAAADEDLTV
jgi:hypothetical protein